MGWVRADQKKGRILTKVLIRVLKKELKTAVMVTFCAFGGMACGDLIPELSEKEKQERLAKHKVKVTEEVWYEEPIAGVNHGYYRYNSDGTFRFMFFEKIAGIETKKSTAAGTWTMEIDDKMTLTFLAGRSDCEDSDRTVSGEYLFPGNGGFLFEPESGGGRKLYGKGIGRYFSEFAATKGRICDYKQ